VEKLTCELAFTFTNFQFLKKLKFVNVKARSQVKKYEKTWWKLKSEKVHFITLAAKKI
jgi:hypothetical protein